MISPDSLSIDWISSKAKEFKGDSIIVEKVIRALKVMWSKIVGDFHKIIF